MSRTVAGTLACLSLFFLLFPLTVGKPGLPPSTRADEAAYYLMALSLWRDGDLRLEPGETDRIFHQFHQARDLFLLSDDGWRTVYYGKPFVYPLLATPAAALFGANGMVAVNMVLFLGMVWLGAVYLGRFNASGPAALFAAGFFFLSTAFLYVFWIHPEVLTMAAVALSFFLLAGRGEEDGARPPLTIPVAAGAALALALAVYHKPMLGPLALPQAVLLWRRGGGVRLAAWALAGLVGVAGLAGAAVLLTGQPWPYLGVPLEAFPVESPRAPLVESGTAGAARAGEDVRPWSELLPRARPAAALLRDLGYFLWGRHVGLLPYLPFSLLAVALFLLHGRRSPTRWTLLAGLAGVALAFLLWEPANWHGGGGFLGNRYFVNAYPAFLFLVTRIRPTWLTALGFAAAGLFLGPLLFTPFGAPVPHPTLQAHVRNAPFRHLPLESTIGSPAYRGISREGLWIQGRRDLVQERGEEIWIRGGMRVDLQVRSHGSLPGAVFEVRSLAPENRVELCLGGGCAVAELAADPAARRIVLEPEGPADMLAGTGIHVYPMRVRTATGMAPRWAGQGADGFYLGVSLLYLGTPEELARDLYHLAWVRCDPPPRAVAGDSFRLPLEVENRSHHPWPARGPARVAFSYRWRRAGTGALAQEGDRTALERPVAPGERAAALVEVEAPGVPGTYELALDLVRERIRWFSETPGAEGCRSRVEVAAGSAGPEVFH